MTYYLHVGHLFNFSLSLNIIVAPSYKATTSVVRWSYKRVASIEEDDLVVFYYLSAFEV